MIVVHFQSDAGTAIVVGTASSWFLSCIEKQYRGRPLDDRESDNVRMSNIEEVKGILLRGINSRRLKEGKSPLATFPETECTSCGEAPANGETLVQGMAPPFQECQKCVLRDYPFNRLRLPSGERVLWRRSHPTFHRSGDYGIVQTNLALYLYRPFLLIFSKWRRHPISEIRGADFRDSRFTPALRVRLSDRTVVLRTPWDYADEMDYDRRVLIEAAERVNAVSTAELRP
jgi:hypothetical protein